MVWYSSDNKMVRIRIHAYTHIHTINAYQVRCQSAQTPGRGSQAAELSSPLRAESHNFPVNDCARVGVHNYRTTRESETNYHNKTSKVGSKQVANIQNDVGMPGERERGLSLSLSHTCGVHAGYLHV